MSSTTPAERIVDFLESRTKVLGVDQNEPETISSDLRILLAEREAALAVLAEIETHAQPSTALYYGSKLRRAFGVFGPVSCACSPSCVAIATASEFVR